MEENKKIHIFDYEVITDIIADVFKLDRNEVIIADFSNYGGHVSIGFNVDDIGFRQYMTESEFIKQYREIVIQKIIE